MPNHLRSLGTLILATLTVACSPEGTVGPTAQYGDIQLTVSTGGVDAKGEYQVLIEPVGGAHGLVPEYHSIPANGTRVIRVRASLRYQLQLEILSPNCTSADNGTWSVTVAPHAVTNVTLSITCTRFEGILVSGAGPEFQTLGLIYADGSNYWAVGYGSAASWSPDGERMSFVTEVCSDDPGGYSCSRSLVLSTVQNSPSGLPGGGASSFPAWHPGGGFIAFVDRRRELYRVNVGGLVADLVAELPVDSAADLEWSRDGSRLAFTCVVAWPSSGEGDVRSDICLVNADGSGFQVITHEPGSHAHPAWHPDGRIAFTTTRFGEVSVATMRSDGSGIARLTAGSDPAWSPDGTRLAVIRAGAKPGLFVMDQDGGGEGLLASGRFAAPAWRPSH